MKDGYQELRLVYTEMRVAPNSSNKVVTICSDTP
jgi:hypothetical protein